MSADGQVRFDAAASSLYVRLSESAVHETRELAIFGWSTTPPTGLSWGWSFCRSPVGSISGGCRSIAASGLCWRGHELGKRIVGETGG